MKKLIITLSIVLAAMMSASAASPQNESREDLAQKQARLFADRLGLDDATTEKFIKLYVQNQREKWALQSKAPSAWNNRKNLETDAQVDSCITAQFDYSQNVLNVRKKYYKKYRKLLTAKQVQMLYNDEKQIDAKIRHNHNAKMRRDARAKRAEARKEASKLRREAAQKRAAQKRAERKYRDSQHETYKIQ